jgi:hypothetical protein
MRKSKELSSAALRSQPIWIDWESLGPERYQAFAVDICDECKKPVLVESGQETHEECDLGSKCKGSVDGDFGPAMNYFYPLPALARGYQERVRDIIEVYPRDAMRLAALPLCLVTLGEDEPWSPGDIHSNEGLALTGGGMDLSWEICEYFMLLGFLPPTHFCDLPEIRGLGESASDLRIISACKASLTREMRSASSGIGHLNDIRRNALRHKRDRKEAK